MQQLVLTDVDDVVRYDLRERATRHGRTLAEEAKAILAEALGGKRSDNWAPLTRYTSAWHPRAEPSAIVRTFCARTETVEHKT
ncbi:MAG: hypothetical protein QOF94_1256 [Acidobacteriaceae bacterium]|jgi:plasmid stability protein